MRISARAKINLTLEILGKRPDGYHDLELIFQPVSLADSLEIEEAPGDGLRFTCSEKAFENGDNLVCRGYERMREAFPGQIPGLRIHLEKRIPSGAGMGGGSTDCAALLVWLNRTYGLGMDREALIRLGAGLGADVPACMIPHAALGRGIGEKLQDIRTGLQLPLLVLKPELHFPTGEMYARADGLKNRSVIHAADRMVRALEAEDAGGMAEGLYNIFEEAVPEREKIRSLRQSLLEAGALGARMTGSGSAVFGIFENRGEREKARTRLGRLPGCMVIPAEMVNLPEDIL